MLNAKERAEAKAQLYKLFLYFFVGLAAGALVGGAYALYLLVKS